MIISDLSYIESIDLQSAEELEGSWGKYEPKKKDKKPVYKPFSFASALADATAVGPNAVALTATEAVAVPGGASASSVSIAASGGGAKKYY